MDGDNCPVLAAAVAHYDSTGQAVRAVTIAGTLGRDEEVIDDRLAQLTDCELLAPDGEGYRPTVTGREFLELDVDCGPLVVDAGDADAEDCE